jgi:ubiquinone/menaquinone biosynthesis C-methylase UbiE
MKSVADLYDEHPDREWSRLCRTPYRSLEYHVVMHHLRKHLPGHGRILDAGGGPGRYAIELCRLGYEVVLLDISPGCIDLARTKVQSEEPPVRERLRDLLVGDVRDLSRFEDQAFDAVLCLDPLSHLPEVADRTKALSELVRVTKHQGPVFLAVRGYFAVLQHMMAHFHERLTERAFRDLVETGNIPVGGLPTHFFRAGEIRESAEDAGLTTVEMAGCEGLSTELVEATDRLGEDTPEWEAWLRLILETSTDPAVVDTSGHMLYVGRRGC